MRRVVIEVDGWALGHVHSCLWTGILRSGLSSRGLGPWIQPTGFHYGDQRHNRDLAQDLAAQSAPVRSFGRRSPFKVAGEAVQATLLEVRTNELDADGQILLPRAIRHGQRRMPGEVRDQ